MAISEPQTKIQILRKLIDEMKGEKELELRNIQNDYKNQKTIDLFVKETIVQTIIKDCDHFVKLINMVDIQWSDNK